jgi:hypothetical protein
MCIWHFHGEKLPSTIDKIVILILVIVEGKRLKISNLCLLQIEKPENAYCFSIDINFGFGSAHLNLARLKMRHTISLAVLKICSKLDFSPYRMCGIL